LLDWHHIIFVPLKPVAISLAAESTRQVVISNAYFIASYSNASTHQLISL
jgi:hypothetical protein